ncbi:MAG: hypothetical protein WC364_09420 [Eubacteriales bacterium]
MFFKVTGCDRFIRILDYLGGKIVYRLLLICTPGKFNRVAAVHELCAI